MRALSAIALIAIMSAFDPLSAQNTLTDEERAAGWRLLFDGQSMAAWRGYKQQTMPAGWQAVDGTMARVGEAGDIITREQFQDFELALDWKVAPGGNSGVMFRVTEDAELTYHTGPEMQILDNAGHPDGANPSTSTGSNYALHAPTANVAKGAGEWNSVRLIVKGNHVEHWLNGTKIVEYELGTPEWKKLVAASKFNAWPGYGVAPRGHIALQDHGDAIAFRNIKVRELK
jgi:hypothetical protein